MRAVLRSSLLVPSRALSRTFRDLSLSFRGLRGIFANFCPAVPRSSSLKFPEDAGDSSSLPLSLSLHCILIVFLRETRTLSFLFLSLQLMSSYLSLFLSFSSSVSDRPFATLLSFISAFARSPRCHSLHDLFLSRGLSVLLLFPSRLLSLPAADRRSPTISPRATSSLLFSTPPSRDPDER